jgi:hypothetical protein
MGHEASHDGYSFSLFPALALSQVAKRLSAPNLA